MTLLLAQPETVTDLWQPLAKAINRFLWRWSPWHLRDTLRRYGYARKDGFERLHVGWRVSRDILASLRAKDLPEYLRFVDRELACMLAHELVASSAIRRTEEVSHWDDSLEVRMELAVLKPWRP